MKKTAKTQTTKFALIAVGSIMTTLAKAVDVKRNCTISAMFHGMTSGNVNFVTGMKKEDAAHFDTVLRRFIPIKWNAERNVYELALTKVGKAAEALGYTGEEWALLAHKYRNSKDAPEVRDDILQDFYRRCMDYYHANAQGKLAEDLSNDEVQERAITRVKNAVKHALEKGVTEEALSTALLDSGLSFDSLRSILAMADERAKVTKANEAKATAQQATAKAA